MGGGAAIQVRASECAKGESPPGADVFKSTLSFELSQPLVRALSVPSTPPPYQPAVGEQVRGVVPPHVPSQKGVSHSGSTGTLEFLKPTAMADQRQLPESPTALPCCPPPSLLPWHARGAWLAVGSLKMLPSPSPPPLPAPPLGNPHSATRKKRPGGGGR